MEKMGEGSGNGVGSDRMRRDQGSRDIRGWAGNVGR